MAHDQEASGVESAGAPRGTGFRVLAATGALCALVAVVLVIVADDPRWLRLGVVAGLWAALSALALTSGWTSADRSSGPGDGEAEALRQAYEAELAREVEARHEFELTLENDLRRQFEVERGTELERLRHEVERLGHALEARAGEPWEAGRRRESAAGPPAPGTVETGEATRVLTRGYGAVGRLADGPASAGGPTNGHPPTGHPGTGYPTNGYATSAQPGTAPASPGPAFAGPSPTGGHPHGPAAGGPAAPAGAPRVGGRTVAELVAAYGSPAEPRTTRPSEPAITANRRRGDRAVP